MVSLCCYSSMSCVFINVNNTQKSSEEHLHYNQQYLATLTHKASWPVEHIVQSTKSVNLYIKLEISVQI